MFSILLPEPHKGNGRLLCSPYEAICRLQDREANSRCTGLHRVHSHTFSELNTCYVTPNKQILYPPLIWLIGSDLYDGSISTWELAFNESQY